MHSGFSVFKKQVVALTKANLKARYRKTFVGFLWVILNPMIYFGVQSFVFSQVLHLPVPEYLLFLMSGLVPWIFISQSLEMGTGAFMNSSLMIKSFSAHPLVYLCASTLDNFVNFACVLVICTAIALLKRKFSLFTLILLPLPVFTLLLGAFSMAWILSTLQVFFRDVRFIVSFALNMLFFLTPIFYPRNLMPERFRWLVDINPVFALVQPFQCLLHDHDYNVFLSAEAGALAVAVGLALVALLVWRALARSLYVHV